MFEQFAEHMREVHNYKWVCPVCGRIMLDKGKLNFHVQRVHGIPGKTHICHYPGCGKSFTTAQYLIDHFPIHGCEHSCHKCGRGHRKKMDRLDHERHCDGPFNHEVTRHCVRAWHRHAVRTVVEFLCWLSTLLT